MEYQKIHLQGVGMKQAKPAHMLKVGDVTIWNYGFKEYVKSITPTKSGKTLKLVVTSEDGHDFNRSLRTTRLVAFE